MKPKFNSALVISIFFACAGSAHAAFVTKATSGSDLGVVTAWGTGTGPLPTSSDVATWSSTSLGGTLTDSTTQIWGAIDIEGASANLFVSGSDISLSGGLTVQTIANTGIYIAAVGKDLSIANKLILGSAQTWTIGTGRSMTAGGIVSGANALTKSGAGKLTLTGANTYSGGTTLGSGTLYVGSNTALGTGTISANAVATLASDGSSARTLANGLSLGTGNVPVIGDATGTGTLTINGGVTLSTAGGGRGISVASGVTAILNGVVSGSSTATLTKSGAGKLSLLNTANTFTIILGTPKYVGVTGGTLEVTKLDISANNSSIGKTNQPTTVPSIVLDGGILSLVDPASPAPSSTDRLLQIGQTTAGGSGTIQNNNASSANTMRFSNANAIVYGTTNLTRTLNLGGSNTGTNTLAAIIGNNGTGVVSVNKNDAGQWALSGVNTYSGATTISAGTLTGITGGSCSNSAIAVTPATGNTANLRVSCSTPGTQWTCASLAFNSGGTGTGLQFVLGTTPSTITAPLAISGTATFNVTPTVSVDPTGLVSGTSYPLLVVGGTPPSTGVPTSVTIGRGLTGALVWGTGSPFSTNTLVLTVAGTSSDPLTWNSSDTGTWDVNNSGNTAWKDATAAPAYYQEQFSSGNAVQFTDMDISADTTVTVAGAVAPGSVTVNNSTYNYTLSGSGGITGTTGLTKSGNGTLTLSTANSFSGPVVINGGTLKAGSATALGSTAAGTTIFPGGILDTNGQALGAKAITLAGGKILNSGASQTNTLVSGSLTVTADSKIGGVNRWDIRGTGTVVTINSGVTLTKEDSNLIYLNVSGTSIVNNGLIQIDGGQLGIWANPISGTGSFLVNSGGTLQLESTTNNPLALTLNGGTLYGNSSSATQSGPVTVQADSGLNSTVSTGISGNIGETGGPHVLTKTGTSEFSLLGTNSFSGTYNIQAGKIGGSSAASLDGHPNVNIGSSGTFSLGIGFDGGTATIGNLTGAGTVDTAFGGTTSTRTLQVNQTTDATFTGKLVDASGSRVLAFTKAGPATLALTGANTYTGATIVNAGTLVMNSRSVSTMDVTVADNAGLTVVNTGIPLTINNLTLGTTGTPSLNLPGPSTASAAIVCQNLTANGTATINVTGTLSIATYPLLQYGTKAGTGTISAALPRGVAGHISDSGTTIDLVVTEIDSLIWKGAPGAAWDINTSANWKLGASPSEKFINKDNVRFDATATSTNVTLDEAVVPNAVIFEFDSPTAYTLSGSGSIDGSAPLLKAGTGVLTVGTTNTFTGPVTITGGTLLMDNLNALGTTAGGVTVASGGTLDLNGLGVTTESLTLSGGSLGNSYAGIASWSGPIQLTSGISQIVGANPITLSGAISGTGSLLKTGAETVAVTGANTFSGGAIVSAGTLSFGGSGTTAAGTSDLQIDAGGTLAFNYSSSVTLNNNITGTGTLNQAGSNTIILGGNNTFSGQLNITTPVSLVLESVNSGSGAPKVNIASGATLLPGSGFIGGTLTISELSGSGSISPQWVATSGTRTLNVNQSSNTTYAGNIINAPTYSRYIALAKSGNGTLTLSGANTYTGATAINGGTLAITGTLGGTAVTVNSSATLDCGYNISGNAPLGASVQVSSGAHLAFHIAADQASQVTRTVTGALTLDAGNIVDLTAATTPADGTYTLISATDGITGTPTTVNLPAGVTGTVAVKGNNLELTVGSGDYSTWAALFPGFTDTDPTHDPDHDGLTNLQEYAFGLDPIKGSSVSPVTAPNITTGTFTYTRRKPSHTGLSYTPKSSNTLGDGSWIAFTPVSTSSNAGDPVETITVTVPPALLAAPILFLRVEASKP